MATECELCHMKVANLLIHVKLNHKRARIEPGSGKLVRLGFLGNSPTRAAVKTKRPQRPVVHYVTPPPTPGPPVLFTRQNNSHIGSSPTRNRKRFKRDRLRRRDGVEEEGGQQAEDKWEQQTDVQLPEDVEALLRTTLGPPQGPGQVTPVKTETDGHSDEELERDGKREREHSVSPKIEKIPPDGSPTSNRSCSSKRRYSPRKPTPEPVPVVPVPVVPVPVVPVQETPPRASPVTSLKSDKDASRDSPPLVVVHDLSFIKTEAIRDIPQLEGRVGRAGVPQLEKRTRVVTRARGRPRKVSEPELNTPKGLVGGKRGRRKSPSPPPPSPPSPPPPPHFLIPFVTKPEPAPSQQSDICQNSPGDYSAAEAAAKQRGGGGRQGDDLTLSKAVIVHNNKTGRQEKGLGDRVISSGVGESSACLPSNNQIVESNVDDQLATISCSHVNSTSGETEGLSVSSTSKKPASIGVVSSSSSYQTDEIAVSPPTTDNVGGSPFYETDDISSGSRSDATENCDVSTPSSTSSLQPSTSTPPTPGLGLLPSTSTPPTPGLGLLRLKPIQELCGTAVGGGGQQREETQANAAIVIDLQEDEEEDEEEEVVEIQEIKKVVEFEKIFITNGKLPSSVRPLVQCAGEEEDDDDDDDDVVVVGSKKVVEMVVSDEEEREVRQEVAGRKLGDPETLLLMSESLFQ